MAEGLVITYCDIAWRKRTIEPLKVHFKSLDPSKAGHLRSLRMLKFCLSSHPVVALDRFGLHSDMASGEGAKETTRGKEDRREGVYSTFPRMMMSDSSARSSGRSDAQVDDFPARERNSRRARKRRKEVRPASSYPAFTFHCSAPFRSWEGEEATGFL